MTRLSSAAAYRLWASSWDTSTTPIVDLEESYLSDWLQNLNGKFFLDIGCGTGRWMSHAAREGARVFGFDLSVEMLQQAVRKPGLRGRTAVATMARLPLTPECADVVLCALALGHCRDAITVFEQLLALPRRGGRLIISDFHPNAIRNGWKRTFMFGRETLEVESYPYSIEALIQVAESAGYRLEQLLELSFGPKQEQIFVDAGRPDLLARVRNLPAVVLLALRRL